MLTQEDYYAGNVQTTEPMRGSHDDCVNDDIPEQLSSAVKSSGVADQGTVADLKQRKHRIFEEEKSKSWYCVFLMLALTRQFTFYLIIISFWMHIYQVGISPYFGALGFLFLHGLKILGTNFVRKSLLNHTTGGLNSATSYSRANDFN